MSEADVAGLVAQVLCLVIVVVVGIAIWRDWRR
jgi:type IV secretory pathway VirB2 component (pilin)